MNITKALNLYEVFQNHFNRSDWELYLRQLEKKFPSLSFHEYSERVSTTLQYQQIDDLEKFTNLLIIEALANISESEPDWTFLAAHVFLEKIYYEASQNRNYNQPGYGDFYLLIETLTDLGIYSPLLLEHYSKEEIMELGNAIDPEKDKLFTYIGLRTLYDRYLAKDFHKRTFELPQERFMIIAMTLMINEHPSKRLHLVKEAYWALSHLYMTVATPTLANAGKSVGQLSSCFIDTVDDSLQGIYDSNTDIANVSKSGGGIGVYLGKIRSRGSDIRGFKGVSSGVIPWMKQLNNTAVSVDQLGQRKGAIAVYLDVWHKDIFAFLDAKLNNGDERLRTHDLFTGVCIPDLFMEQVEKRGDWYLFDPHEVRKVMGFSLEDYYDEEKGNGSFREKYFECVNHPSLSKEKVPAIEIMKRIMISQLETGTPFMFYRDEVNRKNANKHAGMIYCSNLCTEIAQNQSATTVEEQYVEDGKIVIVKKPGDFVVCNLSSINLARAVPDNVLERLIPIQVRMLDNVIDLNNIPVLQAKLTNEKYRAIGLGTFGMHHLFALKEITWESDEAVQFVDQLYEKIAYLTIQSSMELAKEKGAYPLFKGSEWDTGRYFEIRGYTSKKWQELKEKVQTFGIRNSYLMAVAPNASTSIIAGSTASIDPIFQKVYSEEKKDYKIPVTVPDLNAKTTWYYKSAYLIDQTWSIKQNAVRQKHIDQSISFNFYVLNTIKAKELLELHLTAWKSGLKTTYYVRSTSSDIYECESCAS
ncbi:MULTISPECIES: ribonucleoside-diphosphate reductase subunit alpha [Aeribacillus]|jgi:ribonucleoside-diphosphate reductase, alpha subunit|uniref:ribonucleoside-diphosphate reductase subunit alpha n=1 Tax=Aeribacillus TaxID=1055323 RepID=UPI0007B486EE|nr:MULTISPECIES: ribonucleoside-diphosphate reductase subunit alpha [Aeribacillus]KZM53719.1 ribonucleotide-diphosphate reductase subunit alpha [Aeribacillus pallidus]MDR9794216.1 ribonucleoside-diphosphate reductase subunit alpha [Aeribacillus pallidus]MDR9796664.1 ribonucleoside-diphosphate reductase subunit alpha [Aeribacillus pallidus]MED0650332.1 ribonucleoside-diphosphate reductase subunit alpha [Aeribacillus composti]MED4485531.1 ribonucleoside-diphosphate reductase subunit alpha [Aerib